MPWPVSQDYNEAIQSPKSNFSDSQLRRGEAVCNALGIPMPYSGNFADVYQVRCPDGSRWAVKCFTRQAANLRERYQEISQHLRQAKLPFTVDFTYLEQGIRIAGTWYPVLKMQWVEGLTLNQFVAQSLDKPAMLEALVQIWAKMAQYLRAAEVGHCDLQHGNVLLVPGANVNSLALKLIDYDGMWVPSLAGTKSGEVGHPCYQHPQRLRDGTYSIDVDRFPLLLVAASLRALKIKGKALWDKYDNGDNMLFKEADLREPGQAAVFQELAAIPDPRVAALVGHVRAALKGDLASTPLLETAMPDVRPAPIPNRVRPATPPPTVAVKKAVPTTAPLAAAPVVDDVLAFGDAQTATASFVRRKAVQKTPGVPLAVWIGGAAALVVLAAAGIGLAAWTLSGSPNTPAPTSPPDTRVAAGNTGAPPPTRDDPQQRPAMPSPASLGLPVKEGLQLWLDAGALNAARAANGQREYVDGDKVDVWYDVSGRRRSLVQKTSSYRPVYFAGESGPAVVFDGIHAFLSQAGLNTVLREATVVLIAAPGGNPGGYRGFLAMNAAGLSDHKTGLNMDLGRASSGRFERLNVEGAGFDGESNMLGNPSDFGTVRRLAVVSVGGHDGVRTFVDGKLSHARDRDASSYMRMDEIYLGGRCFNLDANQPSAVQNFLTCAVLELLVYDRELSGDELRNLDDYLAAHHAGAWIPLPGGPSVRPKPLNTGSPNPPRPPMPPVAMGKSQVPDDAALAKEVKRVKEAYPADGKRSLAEVQALVDKMIQEGGDTKGEPVVQYEILREAGDLAATFGDIERCLRVADTIADNFAVSALGARTAALSAANQRAPVAAQLSVAMYALAVEDDAQEADDYDSARRLVDVARGAAERSVDKAAGPVKEAALARKDEVEALAKTYEGLKEAANTLKEKRDDAGASLTMGKFYCLDKGDWDKGLPLIAAGGDGKLQDLARLDLTGTKTGEAMKELAEKWKTAVDGESSVHELRARSRAFCWYSLAAKTISAQQAQSLLGARGLDKALPSQRPVVLYAQWGSDTDWKDVTAQVRGVVVVLGKDKNVVFQPTRALGIEPSPGKALVVVYRWRGWVFLSTTGLAELAAIPAGFGLLDAAPGVPKSSPELSILHARYGAENSDGWKSNTAEAQKLVAADGLTARPDDLKLGDPAKDKRKSMVLVYRYDGRVQLSIKGQDESAKIGSAAEKP